MHQLFKNTSFFLVIFFIGCGDFLLDVYTDRDWTVRLSGNIILHYRPANHPHTLGLSEKEINTILDNKDFYYNQILDTLNITFSDNILIYLVDRNEAIEITGERVSGGVSVPKHLTYYWLYPGYTVIHPSGRTSYAGGAHEIVHVITHQALGIPGTMLLNEGYAVAIDGTSKEIVREEGVYRHKSLLESMGGYYKSGSVLKPGLILEQWERNNLYYANAGFFTMFLFETYGIEITNQLFPVPESKFRQRFFELTGVTFEEMEQLYLDYCDDMFGAD